MAYSYNEKYVLGVRLSADSSTFTTDAALFTRTFPRHGLNRDISRVNDITRLSIHQRIINELLNKYTAEEIENNRNKYVFPFPAKTVTQQPKNTETSSDKDKERLSKYQEFPNIQWSKTDDEMVSLCILLYNDRIEAYRITQELQPKLHDDPTLSAKIVDAESRHYAAQQELINFNQYGKFVNKHPIVKEHHKNKKALVALTELKKTNPQAFSKALSNAMKNVSRYKCELERNDNGTDRENIERLYEKAKNRLTLLQTILANG